MKSVLVRHSRGLLVALLTLGLSATVVFAAQPTGSPGHQSSASQAEESEGPDAIQKSMPN